MSLCDKDHPQCLLFAEQFRNAWTPSKEAEFQQRLAEIRRLDAARRAPLKPMNTAQRIAAYRATITRASQNAGVARGNVHG